MTVPANERLAYSVAELSERSGVGVKTIYAAIRRRELETVRLGEPGTRGKVVIPAASAHRWLAPRAEPESLTA